MRTMFKHLSLEERRKFCFGDDYQRQDHPEVGAVIYTAENPPRAAMFGGQRSQPDKHYRYRSIEMRDKAIADYLEGLKASAEHKAKRAAERKNGTHNLRVGQVLSASWGYDQTNIDYYEVVGTTAKTATIRPIGQALRPAPGDITSDLVMPLPGKYTGEAKTRRVGYGDGVIVRGTGGSGWTVRAYPWNGEAERQTALGFGH